MNQLSPHTESNSEAEEESKQENTKRSKQSHSNSAELNHYRNRSQNSNAASNSLQIHSQSIKSTNLHQPNLSQGSMQSVDKINIPKTLVFNISKIDPEVYDKFVDDLCFGLSSKEVVMAPIPMHAVRIKFLIERN